MTAIGKDAGGWTPGPWCVRRFDTRFQIEAGPMKVLQTSWHDAIREPYPLKSEALANARLAAAAPSLYSALAEATELLEASGYSTVEMRAALAKAHAESAQ